MAIARLPSRVGTSDKLRPDADIEARRTVQPLRIFKKAGSDVPQFLFRDNDADITRSGHKTVEIAVKTKCSVRASS